MDRVTICNMALAAFGHNKITSIEEANIDSAEAELCFIYLDPSVQAALEDVAPLFATDYIDLGARQDSALGLLLTGGLASSDEPLIAKFNYPTTVIRPLALYDAGGQPLKFEKSKGFSVICEDTNKAILQAIMYTDDLKDPNSWTPNFRFAVAYYLASVIAGPITHSASIEEEMLKKYAACLKKADNLDGMASTTNQQFLAKSSSLANRRR